jgi:hypothetical protein
MIHPITPPPELVQQWWEEADQCRDHPKTYFDYVAIEAAQWGADQELEACCEWVDENTEGPQGEHAATQLRAARRPKPLSLKEQAFAALETEPEDAKELIVFDTDQVNLIRRALEQLDD